MMRGTAAGRSRRSASFVCVGSLVERPASRSITAALTARGTGGRLGLERGVPTAIGAGRASGSAAASRRVLDLASRRMRGSDRARLTLRHAPGTASAVCTEGNVAMRLTENRYEFWRRVVLVVTSLALSLTAGMVTLAAPADAAVRTCTGATPVSSRPTLHSGDTGSCVKLAQDRLIGNGYNVGSAGADGVFSPATRLAILRFQESRGLVADAIIGPRTWAALEGSPPPSPYDKYYGPNYTNRVLLSFDDCPQTLTKLDNALNWLDANNVGVMFFPTGNCISSFRSRYGVDITVLMRTHRQYVGNHSISHPDLTKLSYAGVLYQLGAPGVVTNYGRPPYGAVNSTVNSAYAAKGMREMLWTVDTTDWTGKTPAQVVSYVVAHSSARSLVLMHMPWNGFYPTSLAQMKARLARRSLNLCRAYPGPVPVRTPDSLPC